MQQLNNGRRFTTDHLDVLRIALLVEKEDVGSEFDMYLGQTSYTFGEKDIGRLIEVVQNMSPGFMSWGFGSIFKDLNQQYPNPFPYVTET